MRAAEILRQFQGDLRGVHLARSRAVFAVVQAVINSGKLSLTSLGRAIAARTSPKHGIKRIDRLLGNYRLHAERVVFFRAIARRVLGGTRRPVLLVDWTSVTPKLWALVAAVAFEGRALVVYAETHPIARYMKPEVQGEFLRKLQWVLPGGCIPIVVTDAGFRSPWMNAVARLGWDYIGRIRHGKLHHIKSKTWMGFGVLWRRIRTVPTDLGHFELGVRTQYPCRLVGLRKRDGVRMPTTPKARGFRLDKGPARQRRTALEPWTLATSLDGPSSDVVGYYQQRMQIEETFRDTKSSRFGISLDHARTASTERADVLLLLAAFAHLVSMLIGIAAESLQLHLRHQANTVKTRRVLSLVMLGRLVANSRGRHPRLKWRAAWDSLTAHIPQESAA
jgi:hypothetical protein